MRGNSEKDINISYRGGNELVEGLVWELTLVRNSYFDSFFLFPSPFSVFNSAGDIWGERGGLSPSVVKVSKPECRVRVKNWVE